VLTWFGREKPKTAGGLPGPATVADVCAGADSARDGTRPCRRLWLPFIPPLTLTTGTCGLRIPHYQLESSNGWTNSRSAFQLFERIVGGNPVVLRDV
jgi:hypothetical protein